MYYTVYETRNLVNGKVYIGAHRTEDIHDSYLGSGRGLNNAIKKYGRENFRKKVLCVCPDEEYMFWLESKLVTKDFVRESTNYNSTPGGNNPPSQKGRVVSEEERQNKRLAISGRKQPDSVKKRIGDSNRGKKRTPEQIEANRLAQTGKTHSDRTKEILREKQKNAPKYSCKYCGLTTHKGLITRYHNEKCRFKT